MKLFTSLLVIVVSMSSCIHVYYAPNTANSPLLSQKGETRINALYASGINISSFQGGEIQLAHAVGKNVGLMINGFSGGKSESVSDWTSGSSASHTEKGNGSYLEFGVGYFKLLQEKKNWIGEVYGGVGFGSVNNDYGYGDHSKVNCSKLFIQPSIGYKGTHVEIALVPKLSMINWQVRENQIKHKDNDDEKSDVDAIAQKPGFVAFEPALLFRGGGEDFKIQAGISFSNYNVTSFYSPNIIETLNVSMGISINIKPKKK